MIGDKYEFGGEIYMLKETIGSTAFLQDNNNSFVVTSWPLGKQFKPIDAQATKSQVGGDHYKKLAIQPIDYIQKNGLGFCEGNVVKYVTRYRDKNGVEDLKKARHYIDLLIESMEKLNVVSRPAHVPNK